VLTGYAVSIVVGWIDLELDGDVTNIEAYQALTIVAILLVILVPIAPTAVAAGSPDRGFNHPDGDYPAWSEGLGWMAENTPEEGAFNGATAASSTTAPTRKRTTTTTRKVSMASSPGGTTGTGSRPSASGFRTPIRSSKGTRTAANFLIAPNETQANDVLDEVDEDDAKTRYVVIDYKMVDTYPTTAGSSSRRRSSTTRGDVTLRDYTQRIYYDLQNGAYFRLQSQEFYNTTAVRLYQHHGSAVEPEPYVIDWSRTEAGNGAVVDAVPPRNPTPRPSASSTRWRTHAHVENDSSSRIGGIGGKTEPARRGDGTLPSRRGQRAVCDDEQQLQSRATVDRHRTTRWQLGTGRRKPGRLHQRCDPPQGGGQYACSHTGRR